MASVIDAVHEGPHIKDPATGGVEQIVGIEGIGKAVRVEPFIQQMDEDSRRARAMLAAATDAFPRLGRVSGFA